MPEDFVPSVPFLRGAPLSFMASGTPYPLPPWADWLISLGLWFRTSEMHAGRRIVVVRLPTRRLTAAFAALGALLADAGQYDEHMTWSALLKLAPGTRLRWREPTGDRVTARSGDVIGATEAYGQTFLKVAMSGAARRRQTERLFSMATAQSYAMTVGAIDDDTDERLTATGRVMSQIVTEFRPAWLRSVGIACSIVTERTSFEADARDTGLLAGNGHGAQLSDLLLASDSAGHVHGKLRLVSARQFGILDRPEGLTILDGAVALHRLEDTRALRLLIVLDSAEYDDIAADCIRTLLDHTGHETAVTPPAWLVDPPSAIEAVILDVPAWTSNA